MWYLIKRTVRDPHSPSVLRVQRVAEGEVKEYTVQEDVEQAIQRECKVRVLLAHSAPVMKTLLGERLHYLTNETLARLIIMGTYNIPSDIDPATKLILKNRETGHKTSERRREQDCHLTQGVPEFLEKGEQIHIVINVRGALRP
jgi:hypothetical protein